MIVTGDLVFRGLEFRVYHRVEGRNERLGISWVCDSRRSSPHVVTLEFGYETVYGRKMRV